jgi:hypothetical protein
LGAHHLRELPILFRENRAERENFLCNKFPRLTRTHKGGNCQASRRESVDVSAPWGATEGV